VRHGVYLLYMKITQTIHIRAPRERVFAVFADLECLADVVSSIIKLDVLAGPKRLTVGTSWNNRVVITEGHA
jgi:uncharacterized protein YndB with AHSA1/START domain